MKNKKYGVWVTDANGARLAHEDIGTLREARSICRDELQVARMKRVYDGEGIERYAPISPADDRRAWIE